MVTLPPNNSPIYHATKSNVRIAYVANGLWQMQHFAGEKTAREYDPWLPAGDPMDYADAHQQLLRA